MRFADHGPDSDRMHELTAVPPGQELKMIGLYPNRAERIIRGIRDLAAIVALVVATALMAMLLAIGLRTLTALGDVADRLNEPAVTGCPFGDGQCGG